MNSQVSWNRSKDGWAVTEQKMLESSFAVCPYWVAGCAGGVQAPVEKAFFGPFFFPYPSRRYFFLSFKKADFVEVPQGCLWVQNDHENYLDKKETWPQWE